MGMRLAVLTGRIRLGAPARFCVVLKFDLTTWTAMQWWDSRRPHSASLAEATPRVDVGEVSMTLVSRGERQSKPASFQFFARVNGRTLVVQVWEGMPVSELRAEIARRLHASPGQCYVTRGGKLLSLSSSVEAAGVVKGSCVELHARGIGGSVLGEWFCNRGEARGIGSPGKGGKAKGREEHRSVRDFVSGAAAASGWPSEVRQTCQRGHHAGTCTTGSGYPAA